MHDVSIATIGDVLNASLEHPATESCPHCGGTGSRTAPFLFSMIVCAPCKGTGKLEVPVEIQSEPTRPGLGDEIKPDLLKKRLREW
jgi:hypothetical protein